MTRTEIFEIVRKILQEIFEDYSLIIYDNTTADDVEGWDSLTQLTIIHEIEKTFDIRFAMGEIQKFMNIGDMIDSIYKHVGERQTQF